MSRPAKIAFVLCSVAALRPWAKFFNDWFERWLTNPDTTLTAPWPVWSTLAISAIEGIFLTLAAYLTTPHQPPLEKPETKP